MIKKKKAFTLFEIVIVVAIVSTIAVLSLPLGIGQTQESKLEDVVTEFTSYIYNQQQYAYSRKNSSAYGVYVYSNKYTIYSGTSLATATDKVDVPIQNGVSLSQINLSGGSNEIVFAAGSFLPSVTGNLKFTALNSIYFFEINAEGLIHYYKG